MNIKRMLPLLALAWLGLFSAVADAGIYVGVGVPFYRPYRPYYRSRVVVGVPPVVIGAPVYAAQPVYVTQPVYAVQPAVTQPAAAQPAVVPASTVPPPPVPIR